MARALRVAVSDPSGAADREEGFRTLDERNLVFLFQEHLKSGRPSNHFNFDNPEREAA